MTKRRLPPGAYVPSRAAGDKKLSKGALRVLIALCARKNKKTGLCFPSVELLAEDTGLTVRQVKRCRNTLRDAGYITWIRRFKANGEETSPNYTINQKRKACVKMSAEGDIYENIGAQKCPPNIEWNREYNTHTKEQYAPSKMGELNFKKEITIIDRKRRDNCLEHKDVWMLEQFVYEWEQFDISREEHYQAERVLEKLFDPDYP